MSKIHQFLPALFLGFIMIASNGCTPISVVTGVGATVGNLALQDRKTEHALADTQLKVNIIKDLTNRDTANFFNIGVDVFEARVLLTGTVPDEQIRIAAAQSVWQFPHLREVVNEIKIGIPVTTQQKLRDRALDVEINAKLTFTKEIKSVNYIITVSDGVVYIMGLNQNDYEYEAMINTIKSIKGVREIVAHIQSMNDPVRVEWLKSRG